MNKIIKRYLLISALAGLFLGQAIAGGVIKQSAPVMSQAYSGSSCIAAPRAPVADGWASLIRTENGVTAMLSMPTPASGTYCYPPAAAPGAPAAVPGFPEVFTLWGIYFNNPENCAIEGACGAGDVLGGTCEAVQAGAFKLAGHVTGGGNLMLSGHMSTNEDPLLGCARLSDVEGAVIHVAVAPHGMLVPDLMPLLIQTPTGGGPTFWYPAEFLPVN